MNRSGFCPGIPRNRFLLRIGSTNVRTRLGVSLQKAISELFAPQSRSILLECGEHPLVLAILASSLISYRDTVASVGLLYGRNLPFTTNNDAIRVFRHALSLDEASIRCHCRGPEHSTHLLQHRARFQPNMFHRESPDEESARKDPVRQEGSRTRQPRKHI